MSHSNAPVINPVDLAAIIARDHERGFAASGPRRASALASPDGFKPANFGADALRIVPGQDPTPVPDTAAQVAHVVGMDDPHGGHALLPERDFDAELAEAYAKGKQDGFQNGMAQSRADAELASQQNAQDELASARALFLRAAESLTAIEAALSGQIADSVAAAVLRLASDRAGQAISDNPAPFADRIERIADRVTQGLRSVRVALNPEDLAVVEDHLLGFLPPGSLVIADPALMRGDLVIRAPSVTLSDLLHEERP